MNSSIAQGLNVSFIGIVIVFGILGFISAMVALIGILDRNWTRREQKQTGESLIKPQNIDDISLVLIAAAVATVIKGRHRIRRVTRVRPASGSSVWSIQGRSVLLGSHTITKSHD
jgi:Na+-transporting methylmalonyl-CoA/oxaloacetate decarboxylase gamma subunit